MISKGKNEKKGHLNGTMPVFTMNSLHSLIAIKQYLTFDKENEDTTLRGAITTTPLQSFLEIINWVASSQSIYNS